MDDGSRKRSYDNSLREEQAKATRERILEAMAQQLAADGYSTFSMARVAKRAGVSEPTIYRHFGGREGLFEAFSVWFEEKKGHPGLPQDLDDFVDGGIDQVFAYFDEHEHYIRAAHTSKLAEVAKPGRRRRRKNLAKVLASATDDLDPARAKQVSAIFSYLMSSKAYLSLKDDHGLSTEEAAAAVNWAARTLIEDVRTERPRKKRSSKKR